MSSRTMRRNSKYFHPGNDEQSASKHKVNKKQPRSGSKRNKVLLTCVICEGDAHGYNFDAISCESCKAFFRRNALRPIEKLKCRGNGHCHVRFNIKKRCKKCRLEKCLKAGMRKEWILSDKEKAEKRAKIEANRRSREMRENNQERQRLIKRNSTTDEDISMEFTSFLNRIYLNDIDWANIQLIQDGYIEAVRLNQIAGIASYPSVQSIESTSELFRVPFYISSMRLITFIKQINEFHQLDKQEQVHIVKLNLLIICFFHSIFIYDPRTNCYHEPDTIDPLFSGKDWIQTLNRQFHIEMKQLRNELLDIFQMDNIVIKLFYMILLFSQWMSLNQSVQCQLLDIHSLSIFKAQNTFTDLLYRYCLQQYGSSKASILFARYTFKLMKLQQLVDEIKYNINSYLDITQLSALTQSLLSSDIICSRDRTHTERLHDKLS